MAVLSWLLVMVPPSAVLLVAGIWVVRRRYGGVPHVLGIAAIAAGVLLTVTAIVALPGISTSTTTEEPPPTVIPRGR